MSLRSNALRFWLLILLFVLSSSMVALFSRPALYIIGDSTVANGVGWGKYIRAYFDAGRLDIFNYAVAGTSSRTFITNGMWDKEKRYKMWDTVYVKIKEGDYVMMQFGHNDASGLDDTARARGTLKGTGEETKVIFNPITGKTEMVHTYGWYMRKLVNDTKTKGGIPIICSLIPRNKWANGRVARGDEDYALWAAEVARQTGAFYIDLNRLVADIYDAEGESEVKRKYFGTDPIHPNAAGSQLNATVLSNAIGQLKDCGLSAYVLPTHKNKD